jgi:hypothetical protein
MAYLNFTDTASGPAIYADAPRETRIAAIRAKMPAAEAEAPLPASGFSALEWSVVALAQRDRLSSLATPGRMAVALGVVFGERQNPKLADPRLEALRRLSVHAWHRGYAVPANEIHAFEAAGFNADQYETLLASISQGRIARDRRISA